MRVTNKLMLACGDGYYKTTRWCGEPKSNWKKATKKVEKKRLREFLRKFERNIEMQNEKFCMGLEYEIRARISDLNYRREAFRWEMYEYAEDLYHCREDLSQYEIQKKLIAHREFLLSSIDEDERELEKLIEFHSYWED